MCAFRPNNLTNSTKRFSIMSLCHVSSAMAKRLSRENRIKLYTKLMALLASIGGVIVCAGLSESWHWSVHTVLHKNALYAYQIVQPLSKKIPGLVQKTPTSEKDPYGYAKKDNSELATYRTSFEAHTLAECIAQGQRTGKLPAVMANATVVFENANISNAFDQLNQTVLKYRRKINTSRDSCTEVGFSKEKLPFTALASIPGSGNTWTRHLIQLITGEDKMWFSLLNAKL